MGGCSQQDGSPCMESSQHPSPCLSAAIIYGWSLGKFDISCSSAFGAAAAPRSSSCWSHLGRLMSMLMLKMLFFLWYDAELFSCGLHQKALLGISTVPSLWWHNSLKSAQDWYCVESYFNCAFPPTSPLKVVNRKMSSSSNSNGQSLVSRQ